MMAARVIPKLAPSSSMLFISDLQTRFRPAIHEFDHVVATTSKMLKVAKLMNIPVVVSEQNPARLGKTVDELDLLQLGPLHRKTIEKTLFSMVTPEMSEVLESAEHANVKSILLMGIESHICVQQTAFDLLRRNYDVYVLSDAVSSCNKEEVTWALASMRQAGAQITTSESASYMLMADAGNDNFKVFSNIIKEESTSTKNVMKTLLGGASLAS